MREDVDVKIHLAFDPEAGVWYVSQSDVPGLRLEADDPMELVRRISECVAELIELNDGAKRGTVRFTPVFDSSLPVAA